MIETLDASIPASREAYLEGTRPAAGKYFGIPLTLVVVSQLPPPPLSFAMRGRRTKKNARRVNTMARPKTILGFFGIVVALWEQLPPAFPPVQ